MPSLTALFLPSLVLTVCNATTALKFPSLVLFCLIQSVIKKAWSFRLDDYSQWEEAVSL